jgi:isopenicillin-N N-acyltransferase-like protein
MDIRCIQVKGSAYDVGFEHGKAMAAEIKKNYHYYMSMWLSGPEKSERALLDKASAFLPYIEGLNPAFIEEMKGVADGADLPLKQIAALNARWELNYTYLPDMLAEAAGGCTAFALTPENTGTKDTYVGQNWDYKPPLQGQCLAITIEIPNRPAVFLITEAGIIGHKGFSSSGIGIGVNFIKLGRDAAALGVPFLIKARHVLEQGSLDNCVAFLKATPSPNSGNMLIASAEGKALDVECSPGGMRVLRPQEGVLVHSNHFQELNKDDTDIGSLLLPDTFGRTARLYAHFHDAAGHVGEEKIEEGLRDHTGLPNSVCRHEDGNKPPAERWQTLVSFYANLNTRTIRYTGGPPCQSEYYRKQLV